MDQHKQFDINKLRGWQRSQLKMLRLLASKVVVPQTLLGAASGSTIGTHEFGGKLTALTRSGLALMAGKDGNETMWQLNENKVDRETLGNFLKSLDLEDFK